MPPNRLKCSGKDGQTEEAHKHAFQLKRTGRSLQLCVLREKDLHRDIAKTEINDPTLADDGWNPPSRVDLGITDIAGVPRIFPSPVFLQAALVGCLFPTATNCCPVLMDRLPRPDDPPPSDYKLDRRGYTCLECGALPANVPTSDRRAVWLSVP